MRPSTSQYLIETRQRIDEDKDTLQRLARSIERTENAYRRSLVLLSDHAPRYKRVVSELVAQDVLAALRRAGYEAEFGRPGKRNIQ